jgi:D-alanyl-D-alanine carboxypeptidase (penicillin-binding protein 5/6)
MFRTSGAALFVSFVLFSSAVGAGEKGATESGAAKPKARSRPYAAAILVEARSGESLFAHEPHRPWAPASLVKMMLALVAIEKVKARDAALEDSVPAPREAGRFGGAVVGLEPGERFPLREMMKAIVIHSANDAAVAVAEHLAGSAEAFVGLMNRRATELGMKRTRYATVHGLPSAKGREPDVTSAYDTAILARELLKHPEILGWASKPVESFGEGRLALKNTNELIGSYPGADGLKTGSHRAAGFNLVATAERDGSRFVAVVFGAPTSRARFAEAARLLDLGFASRRR